MTKLLDTIRVYENSKAELFAAFDTEGWGEIENHIGEKWYQNEYDEINYIIDDDEYSFESANQVGEAVDGLVLFYVQDNGNEYYVIFDVDSKVTEAEELFGY